MFSKSKTTFTAVLAATTAGTALAQDTTLTTVLSTAPAAATSVTSLLLGPFGGVGVIHASVVEADESMTVYALGCEEGNKEECDISPFTVTEGDKDMHIVTSYIGAPMVADYSCTYTALASTDTLSCFYSTTTSGSEISERTTEYPNPTLYFSTVTITAGLELLAQPTDEATQSVSAQETDSDDDSSSSSTLTTGLGSSSSATTSVVTSESSTQTEDPVGVNAGSTISRSGSAAALLGAAAAAFAMI